MGAQAVMTGTDRAMFDALAGRGQTLMVRPPTTFTSKGTGSCVGRATGSSATKAIAVFDGNSGFGRSFRASRRLQYESAEDEMPLRDANSL